MGDAERHVGLEDVVGAAALLEEPAVELKHRLRVVVDAAQQHHLVAEIAASIGQHAKRLSSLGRALARVVEVGVEVERPHLAQDGAELGRDALRERHGVAGSEPDDLDMGDGAEAEQDLAEPVVGEGQRVAAGYQHVAHLGVGGDPVEPARDLVFGGGRLGVGDLPFACAVAAIDGAVVGHIEEHPIGVAMGDAGHRHVALFGERIGKLEGVVEQLSSLRDGLQPNGAVGVPVFAQRGVVGGDRDEEGLGGADESVSLRVREPEDPVEFAKPAQAVALLPAPVAPVVFAHRVEGRAAVRYCGFHARD